MGKYALVELDSDCCVVGDREVIGCNHVEMVGAPVTVKDCIYLTISLNLILSRKDLVLESLKNDGTAIQTLPYLVQW